MNKIIPFLVLFFLPAAVTAQSAYFRGGNGDGIYQDTGLMKSWPEDGPAHVMSFTGIGTGYSSAMVVDSIIYITGMKDRQDYLTAIHSNATILWQVPYGDSWPQSFPESRGSATIDGDRVYVISGTGRLTCLNRITGVELWAVEVDQEFECQWHHWGVSESPLVVDSLVVCTPAGKKTTVAAFDKMTGELVWQSQPVGGQRAYTSAILYTWKEFRYILACTTEYLVAVDPANGEMAWSIRHWQVNRDPSGEDGQIFPNNPLFYEDEIFLTRGFNYPAMMLTMAPDGKSVTEKWINNALDNHHHGVVLVDGYLYGSNWISNGKGRWVCMNWETGNPEWEAEWNNKGPIIFCDGMLYLVDERMGNVGLVVPDPTAFNLVSTFKVGPGGSGPYWSHPSIFNGKLYLRHGDQLLVYDIKAKT
jgi:outer membrane protein assembly factor BamB